MASKEVKDNRNPEPGDLIEMFRPLYQHWAVYIGDDFVVHFIAESDETGGLLVFADKGLVKKEKLMDVVGTSRWRVNNILDHKYKPRPGKDIVRKACARIGEESPYTVIQKNCEHFATEMRYGKAESQQGNKPADILIKTISALHDATKK
ncbi:phospholipase A and acyltransferase 4-like isoform X2 [Betta splendens]|uniref:Phospholipase A and acyltransferase 4-like isoform X2 n=1 Tax=Betta splendens TaxID=158456 RepID=A0A6P7NPV0_BETSP|nr:phospholipase A and acyltransferase 4-like isoform X2 [Betta splendens]